MKISSNNEGLIIQKNTNFAINLLFQAIMKRIFSTFIAVAMVVSLCFATDKASMSFIVSIDTIGKYLNVELYCAPEETAAFTDAVELHMPVWAPGYYLIVDFPKYLADFSASSEDGVALGWTKKNKNAWIIDAAGKQSVKVSYRIYCNARSVAECRVESNAAFIAPNGVFMYVEGQQNHPVDVTINMPDGWKNCSSGMKKTSSTSSATFHADNFDILFDSPILCGNHLVDRFELEGHEYEFALESPIGYEQSPFREDFKKMVSATTKLMGHVPYDNYCLIHLGKGPGGLEHLNSQACYTEGTFMFENNDEYINYLDFATHEYFHLYNVKHIRPIELGPFDYDREVFTPLLWVSEGFTCYYSAQILRRAGLISAEKQLGMYSEYFLNTESSEGHNHMSLRQSSYDIWLNFFNKNDNRHDVTISYYDKGPVLGLIFDIELNRVSNCARSLDDLMRLLYNRYDQQLGRGFTEDEFWQATLEIATTGDNSQEAASAVKSLRRLVDTTDAIDYDKILNAAGLQLDHTTWQLAKKDKCTKQQSKLREKIIWE